ncbi:hypothetical protein [Nonomuraea salmonea]|uniref:hypothetical protein n=1 Tax=Nonomuraea salmonea TaxID=46181 RepID=UPI002FEA7A61
MGEPDDPAYPHTAEGERTAGRRVDLALKLARWHSELAEDKEADGLLAIARTEIRIRQPKGGQRADLWARYYAEAAGINLLRGALPRGESGGESGGRRRAGVRRPADPAPGADEPVLRVPAGRDRRRGRGHPADRERGTVPAAGGPLLVPALRALVAPGADDARARFTQLLEEAGERIGRDDDDVSAWNYLGFARCGLAFSADDAIEAFRSAREKMALRPAPNRAGHLIAMIELLDRRSATPGRLQPVIHDLRTAGARPTGA